MKTRTLCFFCFAFAVTSCSDTGEFLGPPIQNSTWRLQSIQIDTQTVAISSNEVYTISFGSDANVTGRVHCNTYWTKYELGSGSISFEPLAYTKVLCQQPSNEDEFKLAFASANSIEGDGGQLRLFYMNRTRHLNFEKTA